MWLTLPVHVQPPPVAAFVHVASVKPTAVRGPDIPSQLIVVPDSIKHPASSWTVAVPVVVVPSVYVPFEFAVHVPLTLSEPAIVTLWQVRGSRPTSEMSSAPLSETHDDVTFQVPTTSPPQAVPLGQDGPPPVPPLPPPELPPVPDGLVPEPELHAPKMIPAASAVARTRNCTFIESLLDSPRACIPPCRRGDPFVKENADMKC